MIKRILNYFFGQKETNETQVNSVHDEIDKTLKKRQEILTALKEDNVTLFNTFCDETEKPKKPKAPKKPKTKVSDSADKPTKAKTVAKVKTPKMSTEEKPKKYRKPKTDK